MKDGHKSDEALVAGAGRGDLDALAELYDRFAPLAFGLALRIVRDRDLAQDAVQEAFLSIWSSADGYVERRGTARTWLLTIVHRRAVDLVRREERRSTDAYEAAEEAHVAATEELGFDGQRPQLAAAFAELPQAQRQALFLAYFAGMTQSEIAADLGEPLGTVKSRMFTALATLRRLLPEGEFDPTR